MDLIGRTAQLAGLVDGYLTVDGFDAYLHGVKIGGSAQLTLEGPRVNLTLRGLSVPAAEQVLQMVAASARKEQESARKREVLPESA